MSTQLAPFEGVLAQFGVAKVAVVLDDVVLRDGIMAALRTWPPIRSCEGQSEWLRDTRLSRSNVLVYGPSLLQDDGMTPDLAKAEETLREIGGKVETLVALSSSFVYGANPRNSGLLSEHVARTRVCKQRIASGWLEFEALAAKHCLNQPIILRLAPVISPSAANYVSQLFLKKVAVTTPGHDPSIQLLSMEDAARAVCCAIQNDLPGIYNVAPRHVISLRAALQAVGIARLAIPSIPPGLLPTLQSLRRRADQRSYLRYSWTVSNRKINSLLGFTPLHSSKEALATVTDRQFDDAVAKIRDHETFDDFGMDKRYIASFQTLFAFLADWYWRIEVRGTHHIPRAGRGVLVGVHRGFMPFDGIMALHHVVRSTGRYPRFLTHPGLFRFPFLFNFMTKLGGVVACRQNAEHILERDELLGVFPEGIHGAFTVYRDAHILQPFRGDSVVKLALRHRAPIIPFVTVGSAEIFPILWKIESRWWTRNTDWPFFPITATLPFLPLPSKWHTRFLAPIHLEQEYPPEAHADAELVRSISQDLRNKMQTEMDDMRRRRPSIFFGSIFHREVEK
jgi:1-acyl-sn-glycerol-3-phosphate acyltransferase